LKEIRKGLTFYHPARWETSICKWSCCNSTDRGEPGCSVNVQERKHELNPESKQGDPDGMVLERKRVSYSELKQGDPDGMVLERKRVSNPDGKKEEFDDVQQLIQIFKSNSKNILPWDQIDYITDFKNRDSDGLILANEPQPKLKPEPKPEPEPNPNPRPEPSYRRPEPDYSRPKFERIPDPKPKPEPNRRSEANNEAFGGILCCLLMLCLAGTLDSLGYRS
jgi:hypothetical protein